MKKLLTLLVAALFATACNAQPNPQEKKSMKTQKIVQTAGRTQLGNLPTIMMMCYSVKTGIIRT